METFKAEKMITTLVKKIDPGLAAEKSKKKKELKEGEFLSPEYSM